MTAAMEEALHNLRQQERAMKARAEASERLSDEIVASMTSGLLVVDFEQHRPHAESRRPEAPGTDRRGLGAALP